MKDYAIEITKLVKKFGDFVAVNKLDIAIERGEIFGLLGPNGSGKTTTINMLLGLLEPTSGTIHLDGMNVVEDSSEAKGKVGLVTQETVVEGELTATENLRLFGRLYHLPDDVINKRIGELLELAGLEKFKDNYAGTFSGGMQRRLSVVKALIHNPKILVLDEPTVGLDVQNRSNLWELLRKINRERGVTILLTTQYLEEADQLCNRISIINNGKVVASGTPSQLKQQVSKHQIIEIAVEKKFLVKTEEIIKSLYKENVRVTGDKVYFPATGDSLEMLNSLVKKLSKSGIEVVSIGMHQPTLDDVFLKLTGTSLRDSASNTDNGQGKDVLKMMK